MPQNSPDDLQFDIARVVEEAARVAQSRPQALEVRFTLHGADAVVGGMTIAAVAQALGVDAEEACRRLFMEYVGGLAETHREARLRAEGRPA